jgi:hypothetical protein
VVSGGLCDVFERLDETRFTTAERSGPRDRLLCDENVTTRAPTADLERSR